MQVNLTSDQIKMLVLALAFTDKYSSDYGAFATALRRFLESVYSSPDFRGVDFDSIKDALTPDQPVFPDYCAFRRYFDKIS